MLVCEFSVCREVYFFIFYLFLFLIYYGPGLYFHFAWKYVLLFLIYGVTSRPTILHGYHEREY